MRSPPRLLLRHPPAADWPSARGIYLVILHPGPPDPGGAEALIVAAEQLRRADLAQPDAALICDLVAHHPPTRGPLVLLRADLTEVLEDLGRSWEDLGADWDTVAASLAAADERDPVTPFALEDLGPRELALLGDSPHLILRAGGGTAVLGRAERKRWRAELAGELVRLLGNPPAR